jgi:hypothetical protein
MSDILAVPACLGVNPLLLGGYEGLAGQIRKPSTETGQFSTCSCDLWRPHNARSTARRFQSSVITEYTSWKYALLGEPWLHRFPRESAILQLSFKFQGEGGRWSFLARGQEIGCKLTREATLRRHYAEDAFRVKQWLL